MTTQPIRKEVLSERLRQARINTGLTQEAVAAKLNMSRTTIVAIERGQRSVRPDEIVSLAGLYGVSVGRLMAPTAIHIDLAAKFRRSELREVGIEATQAVVLLNKLATGAVELERALGVELRQDYPPPVKIRSSGVYQQAEDAAVALRTRLGVGLGPIGDIFSLFEIDLGLRIFQRPLPAHISGLYAFDPAIGACILINSMHPRKRRMQSLAHEGGHFIVDRGHANVLEDGETPLSLEERFARRFGPAFLMPSPMVRERFEHIVAVEKAFSLRQLVLLAHQFGVATESMVRRLEELDLLPEGTWQSIRDRKFDSGHERQVLGTPEPESSPPIVPPRLGYLASLAIERGVLSEGQLCDLLVIDRVQLRATLQVFPASGREP